MQNDVLREAFRKGVGIGRPDPGGGYGAAACSEVMTAARRAVCDSDCFPKHLKNSCVITTETPIITASSSPKLEVEDSKEC